MSKPKNGRSKPKLNIKREDIYKGYIPCPLCQQEVSAYRVACFLNETQKHKDFLDKCPICRR